ncbi:MAG: rRNA maturation RNase YbeY [Candidatus Berkelbacteria bacterium]
MNQITIKNELLNFVVPAFINEVASDTLEKLEISDTTIDFEFVGKDEIQTLNRQFRNIDKPTDVLSFPIEQFNLKNNLLGSIVICPEIVDTKGEDLAAVVRHGILHLAGYDHETDEEKWQTAAKMFTEVL